VEACLCRSIVPRRGGTVAQTIQRTGEADRQIESGASAESKDALPNGETFSKPRAAMDLQRAKGNLQK